jgi:Transposase DDE domain
VPTNTQWVYVGDRGCDIFRFWQRCEQLGYDYVTRVAQNRNVEVEGVDEQEDPTAGHLKTLARGLPAQGVRVLSIPAQHAQPAREALVKISWSAVTIQAPTDGTALEDASIEAWMVRVWEPEAPEGVEALEWILVTSLAVNTLEDAWQRVTWYKWRWFIEDFHKVLKTGCLLEDRCLQTVEAMCNLLGILTPTAMRLLWLRQTAQTAPDTPLPPKSSPKTSLRWSSSWTNAPRLPSPLTICGALLPALAATSTAKAILLLDGRPYGRAGYAFRLS